MESKVINNALDFIERAALLLWDDTISAEQQLKYSTIQLFEGIELLLKSRLMQDHWSLILRDPDKYKPGSFSKGDFLSVNYEQARTRLGSICDVQLDDRSHQAFDALRRLRNRYIHFMCDEPRTSVMATQLKAWHYALQLLEKGFLVLSTEQSAMLGRAGDALRRSENFLETRSQEIKPDLLNAKEKGLLVVTCPYCEKVALILGDGWPVCMVCDRNDNGPEEVAEDYAAMWNPFWKHPKHGPDDDVAWCENCEGLAAVPAGDDIKEEVRDIVSLPAPEEPGEDLDELEIYICFECGHVSSILYLRKCGYCGSAYFDSRKGEDDWKSCPSCGRF
jgi:uncharacterized protein YlaI